MKIQGILSTTLLTMSLAACGQTNSPQANSQLLQSSAQVMNTASVQYCFDYSYGTPLSSTWAKRVENTLDRCNLWRTAYLEGRGLAAEVSDLTVDSECYACRRSSGGWMERVQ